MLLPTQLLWAIVLSVYVLVVLFLTRIPYEVMVRRGIKPIRAVYYNRKIVHMLAGGVGSLMVPWVFSDPWYPLVCGSLPALLTYGAHASGLRFYWFQTAENRNDVKFALMWAISVSLLWWLVANPSRSPTSRVYATKPTAGGAIRMKSVGISFSSIG